MLENFLLNFQTFLMILSRILGLFFIAPVFGSDAIAFSYRMFLSFLIALVLYPFTSKFMIPVPPGMGEYAIVILSEVLIGVLLGFLVNIIFSGFQMAGEFFSVQMGFGYTEVLDPVSQTSIPVVSQLKNLMGIMVFLVTGAHRVLIETLALSFERVRILNFSAEINMGIYRVFESTLGAMFVIAFKISLPILGVLILVTIAEALMGKAAPQMNILQLSFPAKIVIGLAVLIMVIPMIEKQMVSSIEVSFDKIQNLLRVWPE